MDIEKRYYDAEQKRLIYIDKNATEEFWDQNWQTSDYRKALTATPNSWVAKTTKKFLQLGSRILEGGCGSGNHVYSLHQQGFQPVGVDSARRTVERIQECAPELQIELGDVRELQYEGFSFDGYWSLGVIEHYWNGYEEIASEMERIIGSGGYLFLTFPFMSFLRKWKAKNNKYPQWKGGETEPEGFYQFALNPDSVIKFIEGLGFVKKYQTGIDGLKGLKDELPLSFSTPLNKIYSYQGKSIILRAIRFILGKLLNPVSPHAILLVFKKQ